MEANTVNTTQSETGQPLPPVYREWVTTFQEIDSVVLIGFWMIGIFCLILALIIIPDSNLSEFFLIGFATAAWVALVMGRRRYHFYFHEEGGYVEYSTNVPDWFVAGFKVVIALGYIGMFIWAMSEDAMGVFAGAAGIGVIAAGGIMSWEKDLYVDEFEWSLVRQMRVCRKRKAIELWGADRDPELSQEENAARWMTFRLFLKWGMDVDEFIEFMEEKAGHKIIELDEKINW